MKRYEKLLAQQLAGQVMSAVAFAQMWNIFGNLRATVMESGAFGISWKDARSKTEQFMGHLAPDEAYSLYRWLGAMLAEDEATE